MPAIALAPPIENTPIPTAEAGTLPGPITIPTDNPDVILRQLTPEDAGAVSRLAGSESGYYWDYVTKAYRTPESALEQIGQAGGNEGNRQLLMGIWRNGELAGEVSLRPHRFNERFIEKHGHSVDVLEYWVSSRHRGVGLARLAAGAASDYSLATRGAGEVYAGINPNNKPSLKVARSIGFAAALPHMPDWYALNRERRDAAREKPV